MKIQGVTPMDMELMGTDPGELVTMGAAARPTLTHNHDFALLCIPIPHCRRRKCACRWPTNTGLLKRKREGKPPPQNECSFCHPFAELLCFLCVVGACFPKIYIFMCVSFAFHAFGDLGA